VTSAAVDGLLDFLDKIWGDEEGCVYLPVKEQTADGLPKVKKFFYRWPEQRESVAKFLLKWSAAENCEVFFSPALYKSMSAKNANVLGSRVVWAEFDGNFPSPWPEDIAPKPSVEVQSSTDRNRHAYWVLDDFTEPKEIERINRSLAYALGADTSGWDANQFLRPPYSMHRKTRKPITVKVVADRTELAPYSTDSFDHLPTPRDVIQEKIDLENLPSIEDVRSLATWDEDLLELFDTTGEDARKPGWDRSGGLARIAYKGAELSWGDEQIMSALLDADDRWGKYKGRSTRIKILEELINRARAKIGYEVSSDKQILSKLLKDAPREDEEQELPDFMSVKQINAIPGLKNWICEGLLLKNGLGLITGRPGTGKTQLALQFAADLSAGREKFLDYSLSGKPLKVLFLSLEMSHYQLQQFTTPLAKRYQGTDLDNLVVYGKGEPVYMNQEAGQRLVDSWMDEYKPDVVIIDSLSQATSGLSDDDEMSKMFAFLKALRRYHSFALVFIHHHRKKANDAQSRKQANTQSDIYGSYQIAATIDFALDLEDRGDENGYLDLHLLKARFRPVGDTEKISRDNDLHFHLTENLDLLRDQIMHSPDENGDSHARTGLHIG